MSPWLYSSYQRRTISLFCSTDGMRPPLGSAAWLVDGMEGNRGVPSTSQAAEPRGGLMPGERSPDHLRVQVLYRNGEVAQRLHEDEEELGEVVGRQSLRTVVLELLQDLHADFDLPKELDPGFDQHLEAGVGGLCQGGLELQPAPGCSRAVREIFELEILPDSAVDLVDRARERRKAPCVALAAVIGGFSDARADLPVGGAPPRRDDAAHGVVHGSECRNAVGHAPQKGGRRLLADHQPRADRRRVSVHPSRRTLIVKTENTHGKPPLPSTGHFFPTIGAGRRGRFSHIASAQSGGQHIGRGSEALLRSCESSRAALTSRRVSHILLSPQSPMREQAVDSDHDLRKAGRALHGRAPDGWSTI